MELVQINKLIFDFSSILCVLIFMCFFQQGENTYLNTILSTLQNNNITQCQSVIATIVHNSCALTEK